MAEQLFDILGTFHMWWVIDSYKMDIFKEGKTH